MFRQQAKRQLASINLLIETGLMAKESKKAKKEGKESKKDKKEKKAAKKEAKKDA